VLSRPILLIALGFMPLAACNTVNEAKLDAAGGYVAALPTGSKRVWGPDRPKNRPDLARETVTYTGGEKPGTIVVRTNERKLYLVLEGGKAMRYPVGVGRGGKQWQGRAHVDGKHVEPAWSPPAEVKRDNPNVPDVIPGGSPRNPVGPRVLTLSGGQEYAIHGTNRPPSVGTFATYGCIRMFNEDIIDLFDRVSVGTDVVVTL
jgi:lipoprotein-anchoring transpeptidase ErfK/SrfK